jgi:hypothetical protein
LDNTTGTPWPERKRISRNTDRRSRQRKGVSAEFADDTQCNEFLRHIEEHFAPRRFTNAADAFDTVKAYVLDRAAKSL